MSNADKKIITEYKKIIIREAIYTFKCIK